MMRAVLDGEEIHGQILTPAMSGDVSVFYVSALAPELLGKRVLSADRRFNISAAPLEKRSWQAGPLVIRVEDQSKDTWQNVELSLPSLREALAMGLRLAVVSKWYHLRTIYCLATLLPEAAPFHAISWEPVYAGTLVTRASWPKIPDGRRRVLREYENMLAERAEAG